MQKLMLLALSMLACAHVAHAQQPRVDTGGGHVVVCERGDCCATLVNRYRSLAPDQQTKAREWYDANCRPTLASRAAGPALRSPVVNGYDLGAGWRLTGGAPTPRTFQSVGQKIYFVYTIANESPGVPINGITFQSTLATPSGCPTTLDRSAVGNCTVEYTITQADMDRGCVVDAVRLAAQNVMTEMAMATLVPYSATVVTPPQQVQCADGQLHETCEGINPPAGASRTAAPPPPVPVPTPRPPLPVPAPGQR